MTAGAEVVAGAELDWAGTDEDWAGMLLLAAAGVDWAGELTGVEAGSEPAGEALWGTEGMEVSWGGEQSQSMW